MTSESAAGSSFRFFHPGVKRHIRLAAAGWHTRYLFVSYASHATIVVLGILLVALTIDFSPRLAGILGARPELGFFGSVMLIVWYGLLRSADILARNFPVAMYLGVLWAELAHTRSSERISVAVSGRSPLQCLIPVLALGILAGTFQLLLDVWLRPAVVAIQVQENLGDYGSRFARPTNVSRWIALRDDLISAKFDFSYPPTMREVSVYRLLPDGNPREVIVAAEAVPVPKERAWFFRDGYYWDWSGQVSGGLRSEQAKRETPPRRDFNERRVDLDLDSLWVSYHGIDAKYIPQDDLWALATVDNPKFNPAEFRTWVHVRFGHALQVVAMMLLASSVGMLSMGRPLRLRLLVAMLLAGYAGHVSVKVFEIMGELDYVPPVIAGWLTPVVVLAAAAAVQWRLYHRIN